MIEEQELDKTLTALREMKKRIKGRDKNIAQIIDEEITKISKKGYLALKSVSENNLNFYINERMAQLKREYRNKLTNKEDMDYVEEIQQLAHLKTKVVLDIEPEQLNNIFHS